MLRNSGTSRYVMNNLNLHWQWVYYSWSTVTICTCLLRHEWHADNTIPRLCKNITNHINREQHLCIWYDICVSNTWRDMNTFKNQNLSQLICLFVLEISYKQDLVVNFETKWQDISVCNTKPWDICYISSLEFVISS